MTTASLAPRPATRWVIGGTVGVLFAIPLLSTLLYTLIDHNTGQFTVAHWAGLFDSANQHILKPIWTGLGNSLVLALLTVLIVLLLLAPTMIVINLRMPQLRRGFEFLVLLPISIPAIVLVVGLSPIYLVIGHSLGTGAWTLAFAYGITVLPFAFRSIQASIDAIDLRTLSEASRASGAGWPATVLLVLVPNLREGLLAASLISTAVVLGEFTIASLLNRQVFQTSLLVVSKMDGYASSMFTLLSLAFAFGLLIVIGRLGRISARKDAS
ncbi:MAG TPA: ABC transporter permease [Propionibacteriaceae bacterium]|nr:ABC transporter permease [Propionibacteriaceae bacterium]